MAEKILKFKPDEEKLLQTLVLSDSSRISEVIPKTITAEELHENLTVCCRALGRLDRASNVLKPLIGRMLLIVKETEAHKDMGYATYSAFIEEEVCGKLGLSRSNLYEARKIISAFPSLSLERYEKVGPTKLLIAAKFSRQSDTSSTKLLDKAESMPVKEFRQYAAEQGAVEPGDTQGGTIVIQTSLAIARRWKEFIENPAVIDYCESSNAGCILECMLDECSVEFERGVATGKK